MVGVIEELPPSLSLFFSPLTSNLGGGVASLTEPPVW